MLNFKNLSYQRISNITFVQQMILLCSRSMIRRSRTRSWTLRIPQLDPLNRLHYSRWKLRGIEGLSVQLSIPGFHQMLYGESLLQTDLLCAVIHNLPIPEWNLLPPYPSPPGEEKMGSVPALITLLIIHSHSILTP